MPAQRHGASASQRLQQRPFRGDLGGRDLVMQALDQVQHPAVSPARLQAQRALADRRHHALRLEVLGDLLRQAEALQPGRGQHDGGVRPGALLPDARVHVPSDVGDLHPGHER